MYPEWLLRGRCLCWVCGVAWGPSKGLKKEEGVVDEWTQTATSEEDVLILRTVGKVWEG